MSVEFEEENVNLVPKEEVEEKRPIAQAFIKTGIVKNTQQFNVLMLILFLLINGATFFIIKQSIYPQIKTTYIEDVPPEVLKTLPAQLIEDLPSRTKK